MEFKKEEKYIVLKIDDLVYLSELQKSALKDIQDTIGYMRKQLHKEVNSYVVVNDDEKYSYVIWKLIEASQIYENFDILLKNINTELTIL